MKNNIKRICIIGGSGTGKTTLADNLGKQLYLPVIHIDGLNYLENWVEQDKKERDKKIIEEANKEKWIMDGTYRSTLDYRLNNADIVIYLDYSTISQVKGVLQRFIINHGKEKNEIAGCKEQMNWKFLSFVINWRKNKRSEIIERLRNIDSKKVYIFNSRRKLNKWFKQEFKSKIIC